MEAGAEDANLIICVTTSDELNILAGLMAKKWEQDTLLHVLEILIIHRNVIL